MTGSVMAHASAAVSLTPPAQSKPKNTAEAAQQFEALMIGQMLRTAREAGGNGSLDPDSEENATSEPLLDLADQQFAQVLANNGGFGLAKMIAKSLNQSTSL
jgi:Rod binding domain-containing protein